MIEIIPLHYMTDEYNQYLIITKDVEEVDVFLGKLVPEDAPYSHCHILRDYGSTGGNPTGHIKAMLTGNHCHFPLIDGKLVKGSAQDIWFCEYDGPSQRTVNVIIQGD